MTFDEWFNKIQNAKSSGLLFLFNRLLREFNSFGVNIDDFCGDIAFCISESLKLPDLCGRAIWPDKKPRDRYKDWVAEFVVSYMIPENMLDDRLIQAEIKRVSKELYRIRNEIMHESFVSNRFAFCNPLFGQYANFETMKIEDNLLNVCMQITRTALGFYLEHYVDFDALGKDYSANCRIYYEDAKFEQVREFAYGFFNEKS